MENNVLAEFKQSGLATFSLALSGGYVFECEEIVRCVPGKRLVCRGRLDGQSVYAKLFIGKSARRYAARDLRGVQLLDSSGILTPSTLFVGDIEGGAGKALIFVAVPDSVNAEDVLNGFKEQADRAALAKKLVLEVARHHEAGLVQKDMYLKNFLLQGEQLYTVDGDDICKLPSFFSRNNALNNLALLLSKFDVTDEAAWLPDLLDDYAKGRGWKAAPDMAAMSKHIAMYRRRMVGHYANNKVFRRCSDVEVEGDFDYFLAITRPYFSEDLRFGLIEPDRLLEEPAQRLKSGNTCTVSLAKLDGRKVVVKRYNIKNFWHGVNRALRTTRAAISWSNAHRLKMYGIATAAPIALLEKHYGIIHQEAYFLTEYVDAPDVAEFFTDTKVSDAEKDKLALHIAELFHKLYLLKVAHGDFKAGNMKVVDGKPVLLDLDSLREYRCNCLMSKRHLRDLRRFMRNWHRDGETSERLVAAFRATYKDARPLDAVGMATTRSGAK